MSITITPLHPATTEAPPSQGDDGFGALSTRRGNLPLDTLDVRLATTGLTVRTELSQGFHNPYAEPLEATYIFPLPDRAALTSMRLEADDRVVDGVLHEREQARADYDRAVAEGRRASIAEEERPGVFTIRVGNILPGERVTVRLTLAGQLAFEDGAATLRFPLVVAPRFIPGQPLDDDQAGSGVELDTDAVPDASRITPPVLLPGSSSPVALSIEADIDTAGLPLAEVESSLHPVQVEELGEHRLRVRVHPGERADRDFILRLHLGDADAISSSLVVVPDAVTGGQGDAEGTERRTPAGGPGTDTSAGGDGADGYGDGTFALTVVPPRSEAPSRPRDVVFVLDRSGSMGGWKMVTARRAAARIVDTLSGADRFAVLAFDNTIETPPALPDGLVDATDRHRFRAVEHLARLDARGGTQMLAPLVRAAELLADEAPERADGAATLGAPPTDADRERVLVLVTDGQVGNEDQILAELAPRLRGIRVHTVGIDVAVNDAFLRRIAALGGGHSELVESEDRLDVAMEAIHRRIGSPLVTGLALTASGLDIIAETVTPTPLPSLYTGAALVLTGRYRGQPAGEVELTGRAAGGEDWSVRLASSRGDNPALGAVWARGRLRDLEDRYVVGTGRSRQPGDDAKVLERQIVATSLRFGVLCRFTAYVAIDSRVVTEGGTPRRVTQPVDLPQGWEAPSSLPAPGSPRGGMVTMAAAVDTSGPSYAGAARMRRRSLPGTSGPRDSSPPRRRATHANPSAGSATGPQGPDFGGFTGPTHVHTVALTDVSRALADELLRLERVRNSDRPRLLGELGERLAALLASQRARNRGNLPARLHPVEDLATDLRAFARSGAPNATEADRLWLRVLDVLGSFGPGGPGVFGPGGAGMFGPGEPRVLGPDQPGSSRSRGPWDDPASWTGDQFADPTATGPTETSEPPGRRGRGSFWRRG